MKDAETLPISETKGPRHTLQSAAAVFAGIVVVIVLSIGTDFIMHATGIFPPMFKPMSSALFLVAMTYRIVYAIAGSYITARLAPYNPMAHALLGGAAGFAVSITGAVFTWNAGPEYGPKWYALSLVITAIPCAWVGGKLRTMQLQRAH